MKCNKGYEVQVLESGAGFYIGTVTECEPNCRLSQEYYKTKEEAEKALKSNSFTTRNWAVEIQFCGCHYNEVPVYDCNDDSLWEEEIKESKVNRYGE